MIGDRDVKCDGCDAVGRRPRMHVCPDGWFYIESVDQDTGEVYVVWACSEKCRDGMWKRGPGPHEGRIAAIEVPL